MPSKWRPVSFRAPWMRKLFGNDADRLAQAILNHPQAKEQIEEGRCPMCGKLFSDCDYFKSLDEE